MPQLRKTSYSGGQVLSRVWTENMINKLDGTFVVPGEKLGVVEEFDPGRGTVEVGGIVYSSQTGVASIDPKRHIVSVKTATGLVVVPEEGSTVVGIVEKVQEKMAIINMIVVDGKKMALPFTGMLHVSNSSPRFERSMWDVVKPNDIITVRVKGEAQPEKALERASKKIRADTEEFVEKFSSAVKNEN